MEKHEKMIVRMLERVQEEYGVINEYNASTAFYSAFGSVEKGCMFCGIPHNDESHESMGFHGLQFYHGIHSWFCVDCCPFCQYYQS